MQQLLVNAGYASAKTLNAPGPQTS